VKQAVAGATLSWFEQIVYGHNEDGRHYLTVRTCEDFSTAPCSLVMWFENARKHGAGQEG
jgi:hypothetical protein